MINTRAPDGAKNDMMIKYKMTKGRVPKKKPFIYLLHTR